MANPKHVDELMKGVESWNSWVAVQRKADPEFKAELSGIDFRKENIEGTPLWNPVKCTWGVYLSGVHLEGANLEHANLEGGDLVSAHLERAFLRDANLKGVDLGGARLEEADLESACLEGANLSDANLEGADLNSARLWWAEFKSAQLKRAKLRDVYLDRAVLASDKLLGTEFKSAQLKRMKSRDIHPEETDLDPWLKGANFSSADLEGAEFNILSLSNKTSFRDTRFSNCLISIGDEVDQDTAIQVLAQGMVNNVQFVDPVFGRKVRDQAWLNKWLENIERLKVISKWKYWGMKAWAWFWRISSDYGRSIVRWAVLSLTLILFFGLIFTLFPSGFKFGNGHRCFTLFYFSIVTFTTLGFGDVSPQQTWSEILVALEVILGYVMLGGLIAIFATKVARRND